MERNDILSAVSHYRNACSSGMGVKKAKDRLCNVLISEIDGIVELLSGNTVDAKVAEDLKAAEEKIAKLERDITSLNDALNESDKEIDALTKENKELKSRAPTGGKNNRQSREDA